MQIRESHLLPWMVLVIGVFFIVQLQARLPPPVVRRMKLSHEEAQQTADTIRQAWNPDMCTKLSKLIRQKDILVKKIEQLAGNNLIKQDEDDIESDLQLATFRVFVRELNETEALIIRSLVWLESVLKGDYQDLINLKASSKERLDALRDATLKEEQEYNDILKAEEKLRVVNETQVKGVLNDILKDVAKAADELQENIGDTAFDDAMLDPHLAKDMIEAVIRMEGGDKSDNINASRRDLQNGKSGSNHGVIRLVDSQNNQFVLSRGKDHTLPVEDHNLIQDIVVLMIASFVFGWLCSFLTLPAMFGFILGGIVAGPSGFNVLKSMVQIETLGEFGVIFILFTVGLEFSPSRIQKVFVPASIATTLMVLLMLLSGVIASLLLGSALKECTFIAICLSLSSTPLVVKFLNPTDNTESPSNTEYGILLLGILIMQDIVLGLFIAFLPVMADPVSSPHLAPAAVYTLIVVQLISALTLVLLICMFIAKVIVGPMYKLLLRAGNREVLLLATVVLMFVMLKITEYVGISMELGCFLAGVMISAQDQNLGEEIEHLVQPVKDFLSVIFFASIGLHVFPQFMAYEMTILITFTMATVGLKYLISVGVLALVTRKSRSSWPVKYIVSAGLAQVSEFSFVLGSRARRLGLITREVYLLILGVTTLSLVFAPALWKMTLWQLRIRAPAPTFPYLSSSLSTDNASMNVGKNSGSNPDISLPSDLESRGRLSESDLPTGAVGRSRQMSE